MCLMLAKPNLSDKFTGAVGGEQSNYLTPHQHPAIPSLS